MLDCLLDTESDDLCTQRFLIKNLIEDHQGNEHMLNCLDTALKGISLVENHSVGKGIVYDLDEKGNLNSGIDLGYASYLYMVITDEGCVAESVVNYEEYMRDLLFRLKDGDIKRVSLHSRNNSCIKTGCDSTDNKELIFWDMGRDKYYKARDRERLVAVIEADSSVDFAEIMSGSTIMVDEVLDKEITNNNFIIYYDRLTDKVYSKSFDDVTEIIDDVINHIVLEIAA